MFLEGRSPGHLSSRNIRAGASICSSDCGTQCVTGRPSPSVVVDLGETSFPRGLSALDVVPAPACGVTGDGPPDGRELAAHPGLWLISQMLSDVERLFVTALAACTSSWEKCLVGPSDRLLIVLLVFVALSCVNFYNELWTGAPHQMSHWRVPSRIRWDALPSADGFLCKNMSV